MLVAEAGTDGEQDGDTMPDKKCLCFIFIHQPCLRLCR
jgi:hypothetical protein